jgi:hypothetical protein
MLALYEHELFLNRLLLEAGRNVVFTASCACGGVACGRIPQIF